MSKWSFSLALPNERIERAVNYVRALWGMEDDERPLCDARVEAAHAAGYDLDDDVDVDDRLRDADDDVSELILAVRNHLTNGPEAYRIEDDGSGATPAGDRERQLEGLVRDALAMLSDIENDWPLRELHKSIAQFRSEAEAQGVIEARDESPKSKSPGLG